MSANSTDLPLSPSRTRHRGRVALPLFASPLVRNGYALIASAAVTSALGIVFWVIAARVYSEEQVGIGGVLISVLLTLSSIAQLNFANSLNRFVPAAGPRAGNLILFAYGAAGAASVVVALGFLVAIDLLVPKLHFLTNSPMLAGCFVVAVAAWTIFALQDSALAGLRRSVWVTIENSLYAVVKIVLLVVFAGFSVAGLSIFAAWTMPLLLFVGLVNYLIFRRFLREHQQVAGNIDLSMRAMVRFFGWDYLGGLMTTIAMGVAPVLVLSHLGPEANASYHLTWLITYSLYLIGRSMGISLLAESTADLRRLPALAADAFVHTMLPLGGAAIAIAIAAPLLLQAFGPSYARDGTGLLQVLALSTIPWGLVTIFLAIARAYGWMRTIAGVQLATMILVLGLGSLLLQPLGVLGMGLAWLVAHSLVVAGIAAVLIKRNGFDGVLGWSLAVTSSLGRFLTGLARSKEAPPLDGALEQGLGMALRDTGLPGAAGWRPANRIPSHSGLAVMALTDAAASDDQRPAAILKVAKGAAQIASLERSLAQLKTIGEDPRLAGLSLAVPRILATHRTEAAMFVIEQAIAGIDGRRILRDDKQRPPALAAAANAIADHHAATATTLLVDQAWLERWILRPLDQVRKAPAILLSRSGRDRALQVFGEQQQMFWFGRQQQVGMSHGDYSPGNLLFCVPQRSRDKAGGAIELAGLVDWDRASSNAPAGLDQCHLLLTTRMLINDAELGAVVRHLLANPRLDEGEHSWIGARQDQNWSSDVTAFRSMVGLVWLHHVASNLGKSGHYVGNRLWLAYNVDWVLRAFAEE